MINLLRQKIELWNILEPNDRGDPKPFLEQLELGAFGARAH